MIKSEQKESIRKTYDRLAKDWTQDHLNDDWWIKGTNNFIDFVGSGKTVLDVGCASGLKSKLMIDKGLKVVGLDISEKMIEVAKQKIPNSDFFVGDMEDIKLNKKFDGIYAQACLLHAKKKDASQVVAKWANLLKPSGYLYIAVKESNKGIDEEIVKENDYGYKYERFFSYYKKEEVEKYLKDAGLEIVYSVVVSSGRTNWIQVIGKKV